MEHRKRDLASISIGALLGLIGNIFVTSYYFYYESLGHPIAPTMAYIAFVVSGALLFIIIVSISWLILFPFGDESEAIPLQSVNRIYRIKQDRWALQFCNISIFGYLKEEIVEDRESEQPVPDLCPHCDRSLDDEIISKPSLQ